ncbi:MAG TPA: NepR family anti-sigma factor [Allosphingosinicella sp.]|nr:NepR family anti-sigma factor [Allosphingosinicella sp.]
MVPRRKRRKLSDQPEIGSALRSIYDRTVEETIPAEMLDLLGKLD